MGDKPWPNEMLNNTATAIRMTFSRSNDLAYVGGVMTNPADFSELGEGEDWFDLLPGHKVEKVGQFQGINWEPVQVLA